VTFYVIGICALVFGVLLFEEHMAHIVAHFAGFERAVTKSLTQRSYLNKAYLFYLIFHLLLSAFAFYYITFHWLETDAPLKYTVDMWGMFHMNRALLTCAVVDPMHMLEGLKFFRRKSKEVTTASRAKILSAEDEDELTAEHDE